MPEVLHVSDRIVAMFSGRVMREFTSDEVTEDNLIQAISGIGRPKRRRDARRLCRAGPDGRAHGAQPRAGGHDVTLWNRSRGQGAGARREMGCGGGDTPACPGRCRGCCRDHAGRRRRFRGGASRAGRAVRRRRARVFVEMGTMSPDHIHQLAAAAPAGAEVIDAPVSGATRPPRTRSF